MSVTKEILYIKGEQNVEVKNLDVTLGDLLSMECAQEHVVSKVKSLKILNRMLLKQLLDGLEKEARQLIYLRYFANKTQTEVGKELGISQVQVSRMEKKILKNLRGKIDVSFGEK